jgi:hypothetical protein
LLPTIAKALGKSVEAVLQKIVRLGLVVDEQKKKIIVHHQLPLYVLCVASCLALFLYVFFALSLLF